MPSGVYVHKTGYKRPPFSKKWKDNIGKSQIGKKINKAQIRGLEIGRAMKKGVKRPEIEDERHFLWKGNNVGYRALHYWVQSKLGKAIKCEVCGKEWNKPRSIGWANVDHSYKRNLTDWISLCSTCHGQYDRVNGLRRKTALI